MDYLEASQSELGYLVEQYESQLETLLPSTTGGLSLTSADVERERSYALAETVNGQLDDISKNLGAMIDELNANNTEAKGRGTGGRGRGTEASVRSWRF